MKITTEIIDKHGIKPDEYKKIINLINKKPNLLLCPPKQPYNKQRNKKIKLLFNSKRPTPPHKLLLYRNKIIYIQKVRPKIS